jgi:hypothetical protein
MTTTPENTCRNSSFSLSGIILQSKVSNKEIVKSIYKLFNKKYSKLPLSYDTNIIDNIIYNEKSHIVATFKDRLIVDDTGEFLKRYYKKNESDIRLPKFYEYYELYSKIFPNYTAFFEGKYLYQNIQKKQRMIDLQEKMELEEKQNKEKNDTSSLYSESKENVFNTDAIDSILNGTNNEGIEIIFDVNKNNLKQDEELFNKEINNLIDEIDNYEIKKKKIETNHKIIKNKIMKNNNFNHNFSNNMINSNKNNEHKESIWNKNSSLPINLNYSKNKRMSNSNSSSTINNTNITYYSNIKSIISKFFNIPSQQKNNILNINNKAKPNGKVNSKTKIVHKKDKTLVEKLEHNLFKIRQKSIFFQKNPSQNISTSNQTQKDISISKKNSSIYSKKPTSSKSSNHNQKPLKKSINNSTYKIQNNNIFHNLETSKKATSPLTSRNPNINQLEINLEKAKNIKNNKRNTYYCPEGVSRNKYTNNINFLNKAKSTIRGSIYNYSIKKIAESQNSKSKQKKNLNKTNIKNTEVASMNIIGNKEISNIKNKNSRNRYEIRHKILNSGFNINSRNFNLYSKNKNMSQTKAIANKKKNNPNISSYKIGILDIMNIKKNFAKGFNINDFSKVINCSNLNTKNIFSKTHRTNFSNINK